MTVVLRGVIRQVNHREGDGGLIRQHTLETTGVAEIDPDVADKAIAEEHARLEQLRDERNGQLRIADDDAESTE